MPSQSSSRGLSTTMTDTEAVHPAWATSATSEAPTPSKASHPAAKSSLSTSQPTSSSSSSSSSSRPAATHSNQPTDSDLKSRLESLRQRITAACEVTKRDTDDKRRLFVELELLRLDYIERSDVYHTYLDYQKVLATKQAAERKASKTKVKNKEAIKPMTSNLTDNEPQTNGSSATQSYEQFNSEHKQFVQFINEFDEQRKMLYLDPKVFRGSKLRSYVRCVIMLVYSVFSLTAMAAFLPLRVFAPLLRLVGVKWPYLSMEARLQKFYAYGILWLMRVNVKYEGLDNVSSEATIGMYNHESNLDPVVIQSAPSNTFKYIAKHTMAYIPLIGQMMWALGHIFINRSNLEEAKKSLERARLRLQKHGDSICISPEGTRSKVGRLNDFKKGPFHTALSVGFPIQPMLMDGCFELWPAGEAMTKGGTVTLRFLKPVAPKEGEDHNQLANRVRRIMLEGSIRPSSEFQQDTVSRFPGFAFYPTAWIAAIWSYKHFMVSKL